MSNFAGWANLASPQSNVRVAVLDPNDTNTAPANASGSNKTVTMQNLATAIAAQGNLGYVNATAQGADPTGTNDSWSIIQAALLSFGTLGGWSQGQGGWVYLGPGNYKHTKTLIIPSGVKLVGSGWGSQLNLAIGSNCDMVQPATNGSASQAAILGVSAGSIANAYWAGIRDMALHGDSFYTTVPGYHHGINVTTNPLLTAAGGDPDFDPMFTVENVRIEACTGDGYFHSGRSGAFLKRVWIAYCNGIGFVPSFDTTMVNCLSEGNMAGGYFNHTSNNGAGNKFYNNNDITWLSGHSYTVGNVVVSAGVMYFCILATSGTTAPASDATHWTALAATAPQANGKDWYFDTNAGGHNWAGIESQEPSQSSFYFKGPNAGSIMITGQSGNVNFNNGQPTYNAANPNHYAAVVLDGVSNVHINLNSSTQSGGAGIVVTSLNSPGTNTVIATTDGTETSLFNGGTPSLALVNGKFYSAIKPAVDVITFNASITIDATLGNHHRIPLNGNTTLNAPTGPSDGEKITLELIQDATGSRTVTWNAVFDFGASGAPTLTTTANKRDLVGFIYSSSASKWLYAGSQLGM